MAVSSSTDASVWFGRGIVVPSFGDKVATQLYFDKFSETHFPSRDKATHSTQATEHALHATVLYHGKAGAEAVHGEKLFKKYQTIFPGRFKCIEKHVSEFNGSHYITLTFDCAGALEHEHMLIRAEAEAIGKGKSAQKPHYDKDGRSVYVNDVNPHVTIAVYSKEKSAAADAEFAAFVAADAFAPLRDLQIVLTGMEEHYKPAGV